LKPVLLLSNGHGEDLSGALLASALQLRGVAVEALPLVGHGDPYRRQGIAVLGHTRSYSTGGLGYTSLAGQLTELLQGQVLYLLRRLTLLRRRRQRYGLVVAVGDVVPLLGAWLSGRPAAMYLVAYSSHYEGRLRLPWPCGWLLRQARVLAVWSRDALTASDLQGQLGRPVSFLGNPFLDPVAPGQIFASDEPVAPGRGAAATGQAARQLALLPGSRLPEALQNLELMLQMLALLPAELRQPGRLQVEVALVPELGLEAIAGMASPHGWRLEQAPGATATAEATAIAKATATAEATAIADEETTVGEQATAARGPVLGGHGLRLVLGWGRFSGILAAADLVISMAGTASEQAVGLAKPVLQLAGRGPQFTESFAEAQRRLLGSGVHCASGAAGSQTSLEATATLAAALLGQLADPAQAAGLQRRLARLASERIGSAGGSERMAEAIMELLETCPHG
jgi:uncharacterized protein (TIGR03492 family)